MSVVDDSSTDNEEGRIARFLSEGCKCQLNDGTLHCITSHGSM